MKLTYKHTQKACCLAYVTGALVNNFAALLYLMFQKSFGITLFQIGFLMGLNFGIQIFVDLLGAKYAQQLGYRRCAVGAFVFAFLGLVMLPLLTAFMQNKFAAIVISISFSAIGSGMLEVIISPITEALPIGEKEAAMSMLHSFYCWGSVLCFLSFSVWKTGGLSHLYGLCCRYPHLLYFSLFLSAHCLRPIRDSKVYCPPRAF